MYKKLCVSCISPISSMYTKFNTVCGTLTYNIDIKFEQAKDGLSFCSKVVYNFRTVNFFFKKKIEILFFKVLSMSVFSFFFLPASVGECYESYSSRILHSFKWVFFFFLPKNWKFCLYVGPNFNNYFHRKLNLINFHSAKIGVAPNLLPKIVY